MRTTSNPAFKNLPTGGGYANFDYGRTGQGSPFGQAPAAQAARPMTIDDVVTKTAITLVLTALTGTLTYLAAAPGLALPAALIGFVISLVIVFRKKVSPALVIAYSLVEGVFLGGISYVFANMFARALGPGVIVQAVAGTLGVFAAMLVVYKTGAIRVTPKLTKWIIGAIAGVAVLMLVNLLMSFFIDGGLGLRQPTGLGIAFSLLCIGIAAFSFLLDFDAADRAIRSGVDSRFAWYIAFGLMTTLVWLYLEFLRLFSYLQSD
ncbi:Bax inhibitor-1/YccA family protein [Saccharopolyspora rosea]|uniref:Bax inhibitor-1/YccA family protein n=1 Tax=Saccharopolyspora rosea TaxID=524884 RepID=A0ABW3FMH7_9PSEU|nr:Bax inhibitor-1/YccA family protein [Saccharopolyspora rosea]